MNALRMLMASCSLVAVFFAGAGCTSAADGGGAATDGGTGAARDASPPAAADAARARTDLARGDAGLGLGRDAPPRDAAPGGLAAADYCERSADVFCPFYLRCGRMDAPDLDGCRGAFVETCNARFEPVYRGLEARGLLTLSGEGLQACSSHLAEVPCAQQIFDLDGPCAGVWLGQQPDGGPCGPGIESFVCGEASRCVLGLDLCGECVATRATGAPCGGDLRCGDGDLCHDGECTRRPRPGEACDGVVPCVVGSGCAEDGRCRADTWAPAGAACGQGIDCAYQTTCRDGVCARQQLQGGPCTQHGDCASGWCDRQRCVAGRAAGAACEEGPQCTSGRCAGGACLSVAYGCVD